MNRSEIADWRQDQLRRSEFRIERTTLSKLTDWSIEDGRIKHCTGGFFSVVGLEIPAHRPDGIQYHQPFLDQPEVGILGILVSESLGRKRLLVQAKTEPGNPGGVQLAPTFQCTKSNYECIHGGKRAPFFGHFSDSADRHVVCDSLQSEQGSRFVGKFNRNVMLDVDERNIDLEPHKLNAWRWLDWSVVCNLVTEDFLFNTDFRSVIATSDWSQLAEDGEPFSRWKKNSGLGKALHESYLREPDAKRTTEIISWLKSSRLPIEYTPRKVPLSGMDGWNFEPVGIYRPNDAGLQVRYFAVRALDREVPQWSQPLVTSNVPGIIPLILSEQSGAAMVLVCRSHEPGFGQSCQLSLPFLKFPGDDRHDSEDQIQQLVNQSELLIDCRQSEEGGRFFHEWNRYLVMRLNGNLEQATGDDYEWLTLGEISHLKTFKGMFTNEFRSALTLLLKYA